MAQELANDEVTPLWRRHLTALRDDFSSASIQVAPSVPSAPRSADGREVSEDENVVNTWDEKIESVVEALDELILQSPNTVNTQSPGTPWFQDQRDGDTDTALSSPLNSSWPGVRTAAAANQNPLGIHPVHGDEPLSPLAGDLSNKRKGHERSTLDKKGNKTNNDLNRDETVQFLLNKQCPPPTHDYYSYTSRYYPNPRAPLASSEGGGAPGAPTTATTIVYSPSRPHAAQRPPPSEVRVLMLSWTPPQSSAGGSTAGPDGGGGSLSVLEPDADREALRGRLKARGYRVQCRAVPADDYPTTTVETILDRFLEQSTPDTLLVIYYRGFGCLDKEGRMLFSSGPEPGASTFFWDDVRDPIMQVPGDVLLVFDCTGRPNTPPEQLEMRVEAGMAPSASTKQLLGICVPHDHPSREGYASHICSSHVTRCLSRALDRIVDVPVLSVHRLCSLMREDLRGTDLASRVFVSQLGGGQLLDIYLPRLDPSPRTPQRKNTTWW